ncbi:hypothetical protein D0T51_10285 [Parabacteroides sp. 52]|uniref:hypothetical protein n=1 Tax=unclassified Parabacteroides TaxID=2649774 RepID=UPI0013D07496|nr:MULTISPECIES: hypothetical protein [unclassified Parabacteroides]MDH6534646.1 hypothetical protein [Parabacteroides sp. PM5-20]NDV56113.1 hypothetical protein [Parabacteroides sp. 52]
MKKFIYMFAAIAVLFSTVSCDDDDAWTTDPALEHLYYVGFYKTGVFSDALNYEIAADGSAQWRINSGAWNHTGTDGVSSNIPLQLHSERVRSYDAVTYFWVSNSGTSALVAGTDYTVVDENGTVLNLTDGKYALTWPQTKKGVKNVRIKRLSTATGVLKVNTLDPSKGTPSTKEENYRESTLNSKTGEYEVRGLTHDFNKVTVTFK